jgi:hypothetical protein
MPQVLNGGLGTSKASTNRYYLSTDGIKSAGDVQLAGSRAVPVLEPGVAVAAASGAASVRVWHITSRGWDPWTERPLPEVVRVAYPHAIIQISERRQH